MMSVTDIRSDMGPVLRISPSVKRDFKAESLKKKKKIWKNQLLSSFIRKTYQVHKNHKQMHVVLW